MAKETPSKLAGEYKAIDSRYRRDIAIVSARPKLEVAAFALWAVVDIALVGVLMLGVLFYLVSGAFTDVRMAASLGRNVASVHSIVDRLAPLRLEVGAVRQISVASGKHDFFAEIDNVNDDWYTTFDYVFTYNGGTTETYSGFVNPNETRLLTALNVAAETRPSGVQLDIQNQVWHRVDRHVIPNTAEFLEARSNITVDKAVYSRDVVVGEELLGRSTITLTNHSAYSYWNPEFLIKLMRSEKSIVSLTKVSVPEFLSNQTREIDVRWFGQVPPSGILSVEPLIFYFDAGVYMKPDDETGLDVRR